MSEKQITAVVTANEKTGTKEATVSFTYDVPDTVQGYIEEFGEDITKSILDQQLIVKVQAGARGKVKQGKTDAEVQDWADTYKPGAAPVRKSLLEKADDLLPNMTKEQKLQMMKKLQASLS